MKITAKQLKSIIKEEVSKAAAREAERLAAGRFGRTLAQETEDIDEEIVEYLEGVFGGPVDTMGLTLTHIDDNTVQITNSEGKTKEVSVYDMEQVHGVALSQLEYFVEYNDGSVV